MQLSYMVLRVENLFSKHNEENLQCVLLVAAFFPLPNTSFGESCRSVSFHCFSAAVLSARVFNL